MQAGRESDLTHIYSSLPPLDFRRVMCSRDKFTPRRESFLDLHIVSKAINLSFTKSGETKMSTQKLYRLFNEFDLSITDEETEILYKVASSTHLTLSETTHACFLAGLSQMLYKIQEEEIRGSCCG